MSVWPDRIPLWLRARGNAIFAVLFTVAAVAEVGVGEAGDPIAHNHAELAALAILALFSSAPFAWRRQYPAVVAAVVCGAGAVESLLFHNNPVSFVLTALLASYTVGAYTRPPFTWYAVAVLLAAGLVISVATSNEGIFSQLATPVIFFLLPWAVGRLVEKLRRQQAALANLTTQLAQERDTAAQASVLTERARIARELHDIVAHSISVMVIQAGAAEQLLDSGATDAVRAPLENVRLTGQQAMVEMRRLLGVLRTETADAAAPTPQPGLDQVEALAEQARRDGIATTVHVDGNRTQLDPSLDVAAFRLVQEALSNVRKHARAGCVDITIRFDANGLSIDVLDDGVGAVAEPASEPGHGLIGMRERVQLHGGTVRIGAAGRPWLGRVRTAPAGRMTTSTAGPARLLIVDDQPLVRAGFSVMLSAQPDLQVVGEAADGRAGVEAALRLRPDLILMDVRMPRLDGIAATREILAILTQSPPKILMATTFDLDDYVFQAMHAGASGFILKASRPPIWSTASAPS